LKAANGHRVPGKNSVSRMYANVKVVHISSTPLTQRSWKVAWPETFCPAKVAATHKSVDFMLAELFLNRMQNTAKLEWLEEEPGGRLAV
jgi:hypothetical protein